MIQELADLNKIRLFAEVAKDGSFTATAKRLNLRQSAISQNIASLEESLKDRLFERQYRGVRLTPAGETLLRAAKRAFSELQAAQSFIDKNKDREKGKITIAATPGLTSSWFSKILPDFLLTHQNISLRIVDFTTTFEEYGAEAYLSSFIKARPDLKQTLVKTWTYKIMASREYLERCGRPHTISDLLNHKLITFTRAIDNPFNEADALLKLNDDVGDQKVPFLEVNSGVALFEFVQKGLGIGVVTLEDVPRSQHELIDLFPNTAPLKIGVFYIINKKLSEIKRFKLLEEYLVEHFNQSNS